MTLSRPAAQSATRLPLGSRHLAFWLGALLLLGGCSAPEQPTITLYLAVQRGDLNQLERHIHWGSDINQAMPNGQYPLHSAAEFGRVVMARILLKHGARIDQPLDDGSTPLDVAVLNGRIQVAELLMSRGAGMDASALLLRGAASGQTDRDAVRFLIANGANLEAKDTQGDTALLVAIRQRNHRLANHLVRNGADVNVRSVSGVSALQQARELGHPETIALLERSGAR